MNLSRVMLPALFAVWLGLVVVSLASRSYLPIDETRYVTVAWNMWIRGDFLVPWLNGQAYSDKPPLLFWLMNLGWAVLGVNDWWPRLVPSFFALGSVWLTWSLARKLWPDDLRLAWIASLILMSSALWATFTTATMFDMLVTFFALTGVMGVVTAWQGRHLQGWMLVGLDAGGAGNRRRTARQRSDHPASDSARGSPGPAVGQVRIPLEPLVSRPAGWIDAGDHDCSALGHSSRTAWRRRIQTCHLLGTDCRPYGQLLCSPAPILVVSAVIAGDVFPLGTLDPAVARRPEIAS
ncbi:MAG: phospholipid carrier-dependent glycosyltransferase [Methylobacterium sp.]|nr:phospholipid carrier-dependent glycosyltransferase [Methylobacterium sp.]